MGVGTPLLFPGFSPTLDGADVTGPSKGATVGDFSEGLLGGARSLGVGPNEGEGVGSMVVTSFTVGPNEGESVGSMSVGSSVVGSVVEGSIVVGNNVGISVGSTVGVRVGINVSKINEGLSVGASVGLSVGTKIVGVSEGASVGARVGLNVGLIEGLSVGENKPANSPKAMVWSPPADKTLSLTYCSNFTDVGIFTFTLFPMPSCPALFNPVANTNSFCV